MATQRRTSRRSTPAPAAPVARLNARQIEDVDINDIVPYEFNARENAHAIASVAKSIQSFGFWVPCIIDQDNVLIAGHTRVEGAKSLGMTSVPCVRVTHLNEDEVRAFRLIDNKVAENSRWDEDLLAGEIGYLRMQGFDVTGYGWTPEQIDCLSSMVNADCLSTTNLVTEEAREAQRSVERRAPQTTRIVVGEFVAFVDAAVYRRWAAGIRDLCGFSENDIAAELIRRLGILGD